MICGKGSFGDILMVAVKYSVVRWMFLIFWGKKGVLPILPAITRLMIPIPFKDRLIIF